MCGSFVNEWINQACFRNKIDEIYSVLLNNINSINDSSLYMGKSGICLFLYYYKLVHKESQLNIFSILDSLIDDAAKYKMDNCTDVTFYSEIAWFICHLSENKEIDIDLNEYFVDIDESLYEGMVVLLNKKEYGCIDGAISIGMYFYYRYILGSNDCKIYLEKFVYLLRMISNEKENFIEWISVIDYGTYEQGYNLGIAHGIPGILLFLRKLYIENIQKDIVSNIIIKATNFLLSQKHSLDKNKSYYYSTYSVSSAFGRDTRLGWCYGDMSVGYSLFMVASLSGIARENVKKNALDILLNTTTRTDLLDIGIVDAGLCHGTSGIAHIYNKLFLQTKELRFRYAALYWYNETIKIAKYDSVYAGYRLDYYLGESEKKNRDLYNLSFLTGIAGIGLSLLSAVYPIESSWDKCLLLS